MKEQIEATDKEAKSIADIIDSEAWGLMKQDLIDKLIQLQDIQQINTEITTAEQIAIDIKARKEAAKILYEWLREMEGKKDQVEINKPQNTYIVRKD